MTGRSRPEAVNCLWKVNISPLLHRLRRLRLVTDGWRNERSTQSAKRVLVKLIAPAAG